MLKAVLTGLVAYTLIFVVNGASASAATLELPTSNVNESAAVRLAVIADEPAEEVKPKPKVSKEKVHKIVDNETLSDVAKQYKTTWKRLFDKNETIQSPDIVTPGLKVVIPQDDEQLEPRDLPEPLAPVQQVATSVSTSSQSAPAPVVSRSAPVGNSAGNRYTPGNCTWYVKSRRPDLPNNLGNANLWLSRASAQGIATGYTPRVGAAAMALTGSMHVAFVEAVNGDGTITLSEMNWTGLYQTSTRTVPASTYAYIY